MPKIETTFKQGRALAAQLETERGKLTGVKISLCNNCEHSEEFIKTILDAINNCGYIILCTADKVRLYGHDPDQLCEQSYKDACDKLYRFGVPTEEKIFDLLKDIAKEELIEGWQKDMVCLSDPSSEAYSAPPVQVLEYLENIKKGTEKLKRVIKWISKIVDNDIEFFESKLPTN